MRRIKVLFLFLALLPVAYVAQSQNVINAYQIHAPFDASYQAVLDRATALGYAKPSALQQAKQNKLVLDLKAAGIWSLLDIFYVYATDGDSDFATLNWKEPSSFQCTKVNAPSFTTNAGFNGNGTSSYLNTNWSPGTNGSNYTQNSAGFGCYIHTNVSETRVDFGTTNATFANLFTRTTSDAISTAVNAGGAITVTNTNSVGLYHIKRTGSNAQEIWKNGINLLTTTGASGARPTGTVYVCAYNNSGSPALYSTKQIGMMWWGAPLTGLEAAFDNAWNAYYTVDETSDERQVFMIIGDSNAFGLGDSAPTAPPAATAYESNGSVLTELTQSYINSTSTGTPRSSWIQFATDYYAATGKKTVIVNNGVSSSRFNSSTAGLSWDTNGTLYAAAITKTNNTLALLGLARPKKIFIMLGLNDASNGVLTSTIIQSLLNRLRVDYRGVDIVMTQFGDDVGGTNGVQYRITLKTEVEAYSGVYWGGSFTGLKGAGMMQVGTAHATQAGYNAVGSMYARWMINSQYSKTARAIISCHFDNISKARKALIETWVTSMGSLYTNLDECVLMKTSTGNNIYHDWAFLQQPQNPGAATFTANDNVATNGTTYFTVGMVPSKSYQRGSLSDNFNMVKIKTNSTAAGNLAYAFGGLFAGTQLTSIKQQAASNIVFSCVNQGAGGITYTGQTAFQSDAAYTCARNSGTEIGYVNGSQVQTGSTTQSGAPATFAIGGLNTANAYPTLTLASGITASFEYFVAGKQSTMNHATLYAAMEALIDNW